MRGTARRITDGFILAFVALQLALPIRAFVRDKHETRGNFSWNMYSQRFRCRIDYTAWTTDGETYAYDRAQHFPRASGPMKVVHRDHLPRFHRWLCARLAQDETFARLEGSVACRINEGEYDELVSEGTDVCNADNFGVR